MSLIRIYQVLKDALKDKLVKYVVVVILFPAITLITTYSYADLSPIADEELSLVDGAGVGIVLEDFSYNAGKEIDPDGIFEISGLSNSHGDDVVINISQFYIAGSGSFQGSNVESNPVNIGRLIDPYTIELVDGNTIGVLNKAVLEFATSTSSRSSELLNIGNVFDVNVNGVTKQSLEIHWKKLNLDSSKFRFWAGSKGVEGAIQLNLTAESLSIFACNKLGEACGKTVKFDGLNANLQIGYGDFQPVTYNVLSNGHFTFEVTSLEGKCVTDSTGGCNDATKGPLVEFYNNGPKSNVSINNVVVGGTSFGSNTISNFEVQYLKVTSHDLL